MHEYSPIKKQRASFKTKGKTEEEPKLNWEQSDEELGTQAGKLKQDTNSKHRTKYTGG